MGAGGASARSRLVDDRRTAALHGKQYPGPDSDAYVFCTDGTPGGDTDGERGREWKPERVTRISK